MKATRNHNKNIRQTYKSVYYDVNQVRVSVANLRRSCSSHYVIRPIPLLHHPSSIPRTSVSKVWLLRARQQLVNGRYIVGVRVHIWDHHTHRALGSRVYWQENPL